MEFACNRERPRVVSTSVRPIRFLSPLSFLLCVSAAFAGPTFNETIAPLIHQNCSSCHRPGEAAPFSLITYDEVKKKAKTMRKAMEKHYMPPWHPVDAGIDFAHNRRLSDEQIAMFDAWIEAEMPEGDSAAAVKPEFTEGWRLGEPDLILSMEEAYAVAADGPDIYRNFCLPIGNDEQKWVKAVELRPSARGVVHHSLFFLDTSGTARERDGQDGQPGFKGMAFRRAGALGGYVPGVTPRFLPDDLALPLPKGSDLVLSTHFHPSGKAEMEKSVVGIYFADGPPSQTLVNIQIPPAFGRGMKIDIPAGESDYRVSDSFELPADVEAISVGGHAHYVCKDMKMTAKLPDGEILTLLHIDDWDLNWQDRYEFAERIPLPAGTVLTTELVYDNSDDNPDNPFYPAQRIRWGHESTDEMGSVTLAVVPAEGTSSEQLQRAARMKQVEVVGAVLGEFRGNFGEILADRIVKMDANGDGRIQESEIPPRWRARTLRNHDLNRNNVIDESELTDLLETVRSWTRLPES